MNDVRDRILTALLFYRNNRHLLPVNADMNYLKKLRQRGDWDDNMYLFRLERYFMEDLEELLCNRLTDAEQLDAYRNLMSYLDIRINYTMNHEDIKKAIELIGQWGRSLRVGNGEIPWWENERLHNNVIRSMGKL